MVTIWIHFYRSPIYLKRWRNCIYRELQSWQIVCIQLSFANMFTLSVSHQNNVKVTTFQISLNLNCFRGSCVCSSPWKNSFRVPNNFYNLLKQQNSSTTLSFLMFFVVLLYILYCPILKVIKYINSSFGLSFH